MPLRQSLLSLCVASAFAHGMAWVNGSSARVLKNHHEHHLRHEWKPGESEASGKRYPWQPTPYDPATEPLEVVRQAMKGTDVMSDSVCASIPEFVLGTSPAHFPSPRPGRRRLAWFMSMSKPNDAISRESRARARARAEAEAREARDRPDPPILLSSTSPPSTREMQARTSISSRRRRSRRSSTRRRSCRTSCTSTCPTRSLARRTT